MTVNNKNTILVTGGTGYIGSHTVVALHERGYRVVIADNLSNSHRFMLDRIAEITGQAHPFYAIDLCDKKALKALFEQEQDIVASIHFAAFKAVGESVEKPLTYYRNNLVSLMNLLEVQQQFGVAKLVFSSSCTVYGEPDTLPVTEDSPIKPASSPYGNTKQMGEEIIADFTNVSGTKAIALRYFNPVGAHHSALIGEYPNSVPNNLVPFITQTAIGKQQELKIFGSDYQTPDGTCIRDYIHVVDVAAAHIAALDRLMNHTDVQAFEVYNIGTGTGYSVLEMVKAFEKVSGKTLPYRLTNRRQGDIEKVYADTSHSNKVLHWKAQKSLEEMMHSAWLWEQKLNSQTHTSK